MGEQALLESRPHQAEVGEIGEEDGDEDVRHHPGERQQDDAEMVDEIPPAALGLGQIQIVADEIGGIGCQSDDGTLGPRSRH